MRKSNNICCCQRSHSRYQSYKWNRYVTADLDHKHFSMKRSPILKVIAISVAAYGIFSTPGLALGQDLDPAAPRKVSNQPTQSRRTTPPKPRPVIQKVRVEVRIPTLFVSARSKADIWIKLVSGKPAECEGRLSKPLSAIGSDESPTGTVPENENFFFYEARPGCY